MRTVVNRTAAGFPVNYCTVSNHFTTAGVHQGVLGRAQCRMKNHTIQPGQAFTFDETQKNGATLLSLLAPLGV